jgi:hypothetical protein
MTHQWHVTEGTVGVFRQIVTQRTAELGASSALDIYSELVFSIEEILRLVDEGKVDLGEPSNDFRNQVRVLAIKGFLFLLVFTPRGVVVSDIIPEDTPESRQIIEYFIGKFIEADRLQSYFNEYLR